MDLLKKVFGPTANDKIQYTEDTLTDMTQYDQAVKTAELIHSIYKQNGQRLSYRTLLDTTANTGGNAIVMSNFCRVIANEIDKNKVAMLENNAKILFAKDLTVINQDINQVKLNHTIDIAFFDPPWGGVGYKDQEIKDLYYGKTPLCRLVEKFLDLECLVFKLPMNYPLKPLSAVLKDFTPAKCVFVRTLGQETKPVYQLIFAVRFVKASVSETMTVHHVPPKAFLAQMHGAKK
jgi:predicted RNA methylase